MEERRGALSQTDVTVARIDLQGEYARVEWRAPALHNGVLVLEGTGAVLEPTGMRLRINAVTISWSSL